MDHRSQVTQHVRGRGKVTLGFPRRVLGHQRGLYAGSHMVWVSFCTGLLATLWMMTGVGSAGRSRSSGQEAVMCSDDGGVMQMGLEGQEDQSRRQAGVELARPADCYSVYL